MKNRDIITLCGSTKFKNEFNDANFWLTIQGHIVLSVGSFLHSDNDPEIKKTIENNMKNLDILHKAKIKMSDCIFVIDINNYVGDSTRSEIEYAKHVDIPIYSYSLTKAYSPYLYGWRRYEE